jgi:hypothetical protein
MSSYSVGASELAAHAKVLVASTVDTVTFARDCDTVEVLSLDGSAAIYFTVDGTTPTVGGANTNVVPAAVGSLELDVPTAGNTVVKLISAGTPIYSVTGSLR